MRVLINGRVYWLRRQYDALSEHIAAVALYEHWLDVRRGYTLDMSFQTREDS